MYAEAVGLVTDCCAWLPQIDGVSSKVGKCVGQRQWHQLATQVTLSLSWSLLLGGAAVPLLLLLRELLCKRLLALGEDVWQEVAPYWVLRALLIPVQMAALAAAGTLQVRSIGRLCLLLPWQNGRL
jgi:Na+-driven multidrug efflux pump